MPVLEILTISIEDTGREHCAAVRIEAIACLVGHEARRRILELVFEPLRRPGYVAQHWVANRGIHQGDMHARLVEGARGGDQAMLNVVERARAAEQPEKGLLPRRTE